MPEGGSLSVSVQEATSDADPPPGLPHGDWARLAVADTSVGMDDATLRRATEPFFSTKGIGKSTGLGCSWFTAWCCSSVARSHAGDGRVVDVLHQAAGGHEGVTDGCDFLGAVFGRDRLERLDQILEVRNDRFGRVDITVGRETGDIAEQDGDVLEPARANGVRRFQLMDRCRRQGRVEQIVGPLLLHLDPLPVG